jgi:hypothetical protein
VHPRDMRPGEMLALVEQHAAQALRLEDRVARQAGAVVRKARDGIVRQAARLLRGRDLRRAVDEVALYVAHTTPPNPNTVLIEGARQALELGARQARQSIGARRLAPTELPQHMVELAHDVGTRLRYRWDDTYRALVNGRDIESLRDVTRALAPLGGGVTDAETGARWITNASLNQALHDTAAHHDCQLIWFAEPDACLTCLALAGEVVQCDEDFDRSLTFDRAPLPWYSSGGVLRPPRHPRCRCRAEPYRPGDWDETTAGMSLVALLKRDAERSVLRGWAGASEPRRLDAADRLLQAGSVLPAHVQDIARRAVERGNFTTRDRSAA